MSHPLDGIRQKVSRANEDISNLKREIAAFLNQRPEGGLSSDKRQAAKEFVNFQSQLEIPQRFGVIAGEVVHHLRSSLDQVVWLLSEDGYRQTNETAIAFPIFMEQPAKQKQIESYERKIRGIASGTALEIIKSVQPYHASNPVDDPLAIVHELDRIDKHHNLVLVVRSCDMEIKIPFPIVTSFAIGGGFGMDQTALSNYVPPRLEMKMSYQIAFAQFGSRQRQTVIPALNQLASAVGKVVEGFANEFSSS